MIISIIALFFFAATRTEAADWIYPLLPKETKHIGYETVRVRLSNPVIRFLRDKMKIRIKAIGDGVLSEIKAPEKLKETKMQLLEFWNKFTMPQEEKILKKG